MCPDRSFNRSNANSNVVTQSYGSASKNMGRMTAILSGITILLVVTFVVPAHAKMRYFTMLDLAEQSDVAFVGKVISVGKKTAVVTVDQTLSGKLDVKTVSVTPIDMRHCIGSNINLTVNEQVLIFGKKTAPKQVTITAGGQGKIKLDPKKHSLQIQAAKQIIKIAPMEEHLKNQAMLSMVRSKNELLRAESRSYIISKLSYSKLRDKYKADLVALIKDSDPEIQRTGLQAIQFVKAQDAIPRIAELTRSDNQGVVSAASMALAKHDTQESVAALIELTKHKDPQIRIRACIDLSNSRKPQAKEALKQLLYDKDPKVRAMGPRGLVYWLRRNDADDCLPRLVEMLDDPDLNVRARAARELGECRNPELVPPLIAALKKEPLDGKMKQSIFNALYCHYSKGRGREKSKERKLIDKEIDLIVDTLKAGGPNDRFGPSFQAVGILRLSTRPQAKEALKWAAKSHPNKEIRAYAQRAMLVGK